MTDILNEQERRFVNLLVEMEEDEALALARSMLLKEHADPIRADAAFGQWSVGRGNPIGLPRASRA